MKFIKNLFIFLGLFILKIFYSYTIIYILKHFGIDITKFSNTNECLIKIFIEISFMIILYLIYRKSLKKEFKVYINNFKKNFSTGLKWWLIGLIIMLISNLIIGNIYHSNPENNIEVQNELKQLPIYMVFATCVCAPFCEEIIFRKALRNIFKNDILFVLLSGLIFGFVHIMTSTGAGQILYIIPYGIFGISFGYMYVKTNSIFTSMTFHMIHNTILITISLFSLGVI